MILLVIACGGKEEPKAAEVPAADRPLTEFQLEHGIGPVTEMQLGEIDTALVSSGKTIFDVKCVACHKTDERLVGPPLADVTQRRSPQFIMNMILNPDEMVKRHPEVRAMLATYYVPMTFQNVSEPDARAILEYLRSLAVQTDSQDQDV